MKDFVLAVDPGTCTGWATWSDGLLTVEQSPKFEFLRRAEEIVNRGDTLVVERFQITQRTLKVSRQPDPLYVIGALEYFAWKRGAEFVLQTAAQGKELKDKHLQNLGWNFGGKHGKDALRHLAVYLVGEGELAPERLLGVG